MDNPKADCEALMNSVLPFAEQMLTTHGEFIPFGGAMRPDGQHVSISGDDGNEHPKSDDIIAIMKEGFVATAHKDEFKATAAGLDTILKTFKYH